MWTDANNYMVANNITTPAARLAAGNAVVTTYRTTMITDNGISAIAESIAPGSGMTAVAGIAKFLQAQDSTGTFNEDLVGPGVDISLPAVQGLLAGAVTAGALSQTLATAILAKAVAWTGPRYTQWGIAPENWTLANVTYLSGLASVEAVSSLVNQILPVLPTMCLALGNTVTTNATVMSWLNAQYSAAVASGGTPKLPATLAELWGFTSNGETS